MILRGRTMWWMLRRREYWNFGVTWSEWHLDATYTWYDRPIFQVQAGPFWFALTH